MQELLAPTPPPLPDSFVASALPTRKQYEASLKLGDEDRLALEAAARLDLAIANRDSSPVSTMDSSTDAELGTGTSNEERNTLLQALWTDDARLSRRNTSRSRTRAFYIGNAAVESCSREAISAELATAYGPILTTTSGQESPGSPSAPSSPSFRTKQLTAILKKVRSEDDIDSDEDTTAAAASAPLVRHKRRVGTSSATMSVLARAGAT